MSAPYNINNLASKAFSAKEAIARKHTDFQSASNKKNWKGVIANSYNSANNRVKSKINTLQNAYNTLNSNLRSLDTAITRAETAKQQADALNRVTRK